MRLLRILLILIIMVTFVTGFQKVDSAVQQMLDLDYRPAFEIKPYPDQPRIVIWGQERDLPSWIGFAADWKEKLLP